MERFFNTEVPVWLAAVGVIVMLFIAGILDAAYHAIRRKVHEAKHQADMDKLRAEAFSPTASGRRLRRVPDPAEGKR
jgi:hypothetical protein